MTVNGLIGSIPSELENLSNLPELWLSDNQLSGSIPGELGNLSNLSVLYLYNNQLSGSIPPELSNLTNLTLLEIYDNDLSGCYSDSLTILCTQLDHIFFDGDADISVGNNFDASWEDFCNAGEGTCDNCLVDLIIYYTTPFQNVHQSSGSISTLGVVEIYNGQQVAYKAPSVRLNNSFSAKAGSSFKVSYGNCN